MWFCNYDYLTQSITIQKTFIWDAETMSIYEDGSWVLEEISVLKKSNARVECKLKDIIESLRGIRLTLKSLVNERLEKYEDQQKDLYLRLLTVIDHAEQSENPDVRHYGDEVYDALHDKVGLKRIEHQRGKCFDRGLQCIVDTQYKSGANKDEVLEVTRDGYMLGERLFRPQEVIIAEDSSESLSDAVTLKSTERTHPELDKKLPTIEQGQGIQQVTRGERPSRTNKRDSYCISQRELCNNEGYASITQMRNNVSAQTDFKEIVRLSEVSDTPHKNIRLQGQKLYNKRSIRKEKNGFLSQLSILWAWLREGFSSTFGGLVLRTRAKRRNSDSDRQNSDSDRQ